MDTDQMRSSDNVVALCENPAVIRRAYLAEKIVIVDGQAGCGKTMLSPIIAALDRVELLTYSYELEQVCGMRYLGKIEDDAAVMMVRYLTDLKLYHMMMGRETNFRPSDLSSVFRDANPWRYLKRIFQPGDELIPDRIRKARPILNLTTHNLLGVAEPLFKALGKRLVFVDVVRHPLYMVKQSFLNKERLVSDARNFTLHIDHKGQEVPFYAASWKDLYIASNNREKVIHEIDCLTRMRNKVKNEMIETMGAQIVTVPFESFVTAPWGYLRTFEELLETKVTRMTVKMMKKQRVPRAKYAGGINLKIYRRCGWQPPAPGSNEIAELAARWSFVVENISSDAVKILKVLCADYEDQYLGGRKTYAYANS